MNFYKHYIGDFQRDTGHLSLTERGAYLALIHHYYATEKPLPNNLDALCRIAGAATKQERVAVKAVMIFFEPVESGLMHSRIEAEIEKAGKVANTNRDIALAREAKRRAEKESRTEHDQSTNRAQDVSRIEHDQSTNGALARASQTPDTRHQDNSVGSDVVTPPLVESPPPSREHATRKGELCKRLRAIGIDAAPHLPVWEETLLQFDDEAIIAVAEIAKTKKPGERISLNYLAPMLTNPPKPTAIGKRTPAPDNFDEKNYGPGGLL